MREGILYGYVFLKIKSSCDCYKVITNEKLNYVLGYHFRIPKQLRPKVIKEFTSMGLLMRNDKRGYRVNDSVRKSVFDVINSLLETTL